VRGTIRFLSRKNPALIISQALPGVHAAGMGAERAFIPGVPKGSSELENFFPLLLIRRPIPAKLKKKFRLFLQNSLKLAIFLKIDEIISFILGEKAFFFTIEENISSISPARHPGLNIHQVEAGL
jgi:hypothetical protein